MQDYIVTYTGRKFFPLKPILDDIEIEDIAHSLSMMTRANGHFKHFYSVAQHAINCYKEAKSRGYSKRVQLGCLLHDSSESYISDLTRPVKGQLPEYEAIEEKLQKTIYKRYCLGDLTEEEKHLIANVDDTLLYLEFLELMGIRLFEVPYKDYAKHDFAQRDFNNVKSEFIYIFDRLTKEKEGFYSVGIDGGRSGWIAVVITDSGFEVELYKSIEEICSKYADSDSLLVDMPIGLPEGTNDIRPDAKARTYLSGRSSCIFNTPCRQAVYEENYFEASRINKNCLGKGLSKQSFSLCSQIREIDEFLQKMPSFKGKLRESHSEICFTVLETEGVFYFPLYNSKHTEDGFWDRVEVLEKFYDQTQEFVSHILSHPVLKSLRADCMDALCLAVSGRLGLNFGFSTIPSAPTKDVRGLDMEIVYATLKLL